MTGAQMIVQVLADEGTTTIFGYSGGAILPTYDAVFVHNKACADAGQPGMPLIVPADLKGRYLRGLSASSTNEDILRVVHQQTKTAFGPLRTSDIGVNNRDLAIFKTDLGLSERLIPQFPAGTIAVSESGIFTAADAWEKLTAGAGSHASVAGS